MLKVIEMLDSDGDGVSNVEEIFLGAMLGDVDNKLKVSMFLYGESNLDYMVGEWDYGFVFWWVLVIYCGWLSSYEENQLFVLVDDFYVILYVKLDECFNSAYWWDEVVLCMGDGVIRVIDFGMLWKWDDCLFCYVFLGDIDLRDLLLVKYYVWELDGVLVKIEGVIFEIFGFCDLVNSNVCDPD